MAILGLAVGPGAIHFLPMSLLWVGKAFVIFMAPYYVGKYCQKAEITPFWPFIRENVWPLTFNHIKSACWILLYLILLIVPGLYKAIRYSFVTQATFFDKKQKSALQASSQTTKGFFWPLAVLAVLSLIFPVLLNFLIKKGAFLSFLPSIWQKIFSGELHIIVSFFWDCFYLSFLTHLYFELKNRDSTTN